MSKRRYTTLQDIKDIVSIYNDCGSYSLKCWNYADYKHLNLWWSWISQESCIVLFGTSHPKRFKQEKFIASVDDLKDFVKFIDNGTHERNNCEILVINKDNHHPMKITFTGSSNVEKEVNFNVDYTDGHNSWKITLRNQWMKIKYKVCNFFKFK